MLITLLPDVPALGVTSPLVHEEEELASAQNRGSQVDVLETGRRTMGYKLNALGNLPVDGTVNSYIFVLKSAFSDNLTDVIEKNFDNIAREIGNDAIIADGLNEERWLDEVGLKYLGQDWFLYTSLLPAFLITDSHPDDVTEKSKRIFIPLVEVPKQFPNWTTFFRMLVKYVRREPNELTTRLQKGADAFDVLNGIFKINPGFLGISIDFNALASSVRDFKKNQRQPPLVRGG